MLTAEQIRGVERDVRQVLLERGSQWDAAMRVRGVAELSDRIAELSALVAGDAVREQVALAAFAVHADRLNARLAVSGWPGDGASSSELQQASEALRRLGVGAAREHRPLAQPEAEALMELARIGAHVAVVSSQQARAQIIAGGVPQRVRGTVAEIARLEASAARMELAVGPGGGMPAQGARVSTAVLRWEVAVGDALARRASLATVQEIARTQTVLYAAAHAVVQLPEPPENQVPDAAWLAESLRDGHGRWEAAASVLGQMRYRGEEPFDRGIVAARMLLTAELAPVVKDASAMPEQARQAVRVALQEAIAQAPGIAEEIREQVQQSRWQAPARVVHEASRRAVVEDPVRYPASTIWMPLDIVQSNGPVPLTAAAVGHVDLVCRDVEQAATRAAQRSTLMLPRTPARAEAPAASSVPGLERSRRQEERRLPCSAASPAPDRELAR